MTALRVLGVIVLILFALGLLRLGAVVDFGGELHVTLRIGPWKRTILPKPERAKKQTKAEKVKPEDEAKKKAKPALPKPTLDEGLDFLQTALAALRKTLRRTCRRLRIDPLRVRVVFAGDDPADVAQTYGYANAVLWTVMPRLEDTFSIPSPSVFLDMDFDAEHTTAEGSIGFSLRVGDLLIIALTLTLPLLRWFLRWRKAHRAAGEPGQTPDAAQEQAKQAEKLSA